LLVQNSLESAGGLALNPEEYLRLASCREERLREL